MSFRPLTIPVGIVVMDILQYIMHRLAHTIPALYRHHKVHHEMKELSSVGGLYNDYAEAIVSSGVMGIVFNCLLGFSMLEFSILSSLSFIATVRLHSPQFGKTNHWRHHNGFKNYNFQQPFGTWLDKLMGTYK